MCKRLLSTVMLSLVAILTFNAATPTAYASSLAATAPQAPAAPSAPKIASSVTESTETKTEANPTSVTTNAEAKTSTEKETTTSAQVENNVPTTSAPDQTTVQSNLPSPEQVVQKVCRILDPSQPIYAAVEVKIDANGVLSYTQPTDIIPEIPSLPKGLNWSEIGRFIYNNDCNIPVPMSVSAQVCMENDGTLKGGVSVSSEVTTVHLTPELLQGPYKVTVTKDYTPIFSGDVTVDSLPDFASLDKFAVEKIKQAVGKAQPGVYTVVVKHTDTTIATIVVMLDRCSTPTLVTPATPTINDVCGIENDTFTIPNSRGVIYHVEDPSDLVLPWHKPGTYPYNPQTHGPLTIAAQPIQPEYGFSPETIGRWTFNFTNTSCLTEEEPTDDPGDDTPVEEQPGDTTDDGHVLGDTTSVTPPTSTPTTPQILSISTAEDIPDSIPSTGSDAGSQYLILGLALSALAYFGVLRFTSRQ